jgi:hypothetical protein
MSTLLLKHLQEPGLDELKNRSHIITRERRVSRRVIPALSLGVFGIFAIRGFTCPVTGAGSNGRCNTIWYIAAFKGGVYETRETVWAFGGAEERRVATLEGGADVA